MRFKKVLSEFKLILLGVVFSVTPGLAGGVITLDGDLSDFLPYRLDWIFDELPGDASPGMDLVDLFAYPGPSYSDSLYVAFTLSGSITADSVVLYFVTLAGDTLLNLGNLQQGRCVTVNQREFECGIPWQTLPVLVQGDVAFLTFFTYHSGNVADRAPDFGFYVLPVPTRINEVLDGTSVHTNDAFLEFMFNKYFRQKRVLGRVTEGKE